MAPPRNNPPRPRRTLIVLFIVMVGMVLLGAGRSMPKLGLDLEGGTSVTLTAVTGNGKAPSADQMDESVKIMNDRVNDLGVSEAQVTRQGSDVIVIQVPGRGQHKLLGLIGATAKLQFRQVYAEQAAAPSPPGGTFQGDPDKAVVTQFQQADCSKKGTQLAGADEEAKRWVAACDKDGTGKYLLGPVRVQGEQINSAEAMPPDPGQGRPGWAVDLTFKSRGAGQFYDVTRDAYTTYRNDPASPLRKVAIVLDGRAISAPEITNGPISGGRAEISGNAGSFTEEYATDLAHVLKYGALPLEFTKSAESSVSPELGAEQLKAGLEAGGIGLALVVLYCLFYYRALGLVAIAGLAVSGLLTYMSVVLLGNFIDYRLSLAGVIGLVVAIGITADSFVVYIERVRDEVRAGHSLRLAAERGWRRARRTILVADAVSFMCGLVLYMVSVGSVQGFAFTLGLTTLIDVAVVSLFGKPIISLLAGTDILGPDRAPGRRDRVRTGGRGLLPRPGSIGERLNRGERSACVVSRRKLWYSISGAILIAGLTSLLTLGLNFGIEFKGGSVLQFNAPHTTAAQVARTIHSSGAVGGTPIVQKTGIGWRVQTEALDGDQVTKVQETLDNTYHLGGPDKVNPETVGPSWGSDISTKALQGLLIFLVLAVGYLSIAFEWRMAAAAIVAMAHDLLLTAGVYSLVRFEVSPASVVGLLTILGYSLYDTVVVFDKVRENTAGLSRTSVVAYRDAAERAVDQTLTRSINTTLIALLPVAGLLFIGAGILRAGTLTDLALVLFIGILTGAYSSICIATPVLVGLKERTKTAGRGSPARPDQKATSGSRSE
jgi:protein-export membrane protein SecD/preprotein translocase SecF subunit